MLAIAQQRTIETLEAGIAAGGDPETLLDAAEAEEVAEEGAAWLRLCRGPYPRRTSGEILHGALLPAAAYVDLDGNDWDDTAFCKVQS